MSVHFHVGQKVVCIDDSGTNAWGIPEIVRGHVYTIRAIVEPDELMAALFGRPLDEIGLMLEEVHRGIDCPEMGEPPFGALRFRPAQSRKTDISIFTAMLTPSKVRADA